jgi:hypothetical protein
MLAPDLAVYDEAAFSSPPNARGTIPDLSKAAAPYRKFLAIFQNGWQEAEAEGQHLKYREDDGDG